MSIKTITIDNVNVGDLVDTGDLFFVCTRRSDVGLHGVIVSDNGLFDVSAVNLFFETLLCWEGDVDILAENVRIYFERPASVESAHL